MKKLRILYVIVAAVVVLGLMLPALTERISYEQSHNGYVVALLAQEKMEPSHFDRYKSGGIDTVLIEEKNGSFNEELIELCASKGFEIVPVVYSGNKKPEHFENDLELIIEKNNVRYMVVRQSEDENNHPAPIENIIKNHSLTLVEFENKNQLSNEMPVGYKEYIEASDGRIMRAYKTLENPLRTIVTGGEGENAGELLYHHMINSATDRNTEFIYLCQIDDGSGNTDKNIEQTIYAANRFAKEMESSGHQNKKDVSLAGYALPSKATYGGAALLCFIMLAFMAEIVFKKEFAFIWYTMLPLGIAAFFASFAMPQKLLELYPTAFALLAPCFCFTFCVWVSEKTKDRFGVTVCIISIFAAAVASLTLCAVVTGSLLSGADYLLNNKLFRGVKLTLLLPVAYAAIAMLIYLSGGKFRAELPPVRDIAKKIKLRHVILAVLILLAGGIYVLRSGNTKISGFEVAMRNFISDVFSVRPRTKEFLIGWPMLSLFAYYSKHSYGKIFRWLTAVGSSIIFASVSNTFCHVFTDFLTSSLRTINGLALSVPFIVVFLLANLLFVKIYVRKQKLN